MYIQTSFIANNLFITTLYIYITHIDAIMPELVNQSAIIQCMSAIGYQVDQEGMCYGISVMAEQALFAGELQQFLDRIHEIEANSEGFETYFNALAAKERTDLLAFFDGIALSQNPALYSRDRPTPDLPLIFDNHIATSVQAQHVRYAAALIKPVKLEEDIERVALVSGCNNPVLFRERLECILRHAGSKPFSLTLDAREHATTILYDPERAIFMLFDPNQIPRQVSLTEINELCRMVYKSTGFNEKGGISITLNVSSSKEQLDSIARNLSQDSNWLRLNHQRFTDLIKETDFKMSFMAAWPTDLTSCQDILTYLSKQGADVYAVLGYSAAGYYAYCLNHHLDINNSEDNMSAYYRDVLHPPIHDDKILATVKLNGLALERASSSKKDNKTVVIKAIQQNPVAFKFASDTLKKNAKFLLEAYQLAPNLLNFMDSTMIKLLVQQDTTLFLKLSTQLQNDPLIAIEAIKQQPRLLFSAGPDVKNNVEVVRVAIQKERNLVYFAGNDAIKTLLDNEEIEYSDLSTVQQPNFQAFATTEPLSEKDIKKFKSLLVKLDNVLMKSNRQDIVNVFSQLCDKVVKLVDHIPTQSRSFKSIFRRLIEKTPLPTTESIQTLVNILSEKNNAELRQAFGVHENKSSPKALREAVQSRVNAILDAGNMRATVEKAFDSSSLQGQRRNDNT